ncbi:hypothetical protein [Geodermatophilus sp. CPCC 206100]|uniref:hypothetical protein n=1 Tax=Geodermatophilus sp. CPCC 206100 TaxID=3020054 RepID=UPI003AFF6D4B
MKRSRLLVVVGMTAAMTVGGVSPALADGDRHGGGSSASVDIGNRAWANGHPAHRVAVKVDYRCSDHDKRGDIWVGLWQNGAYYEGSDRARCDGRHRDEVVDLRKQSREHVHDGHAYVKAVLKADRQTARDEARVRVSNAGSPRDDRGGGHH